VNHLITVGRYDDASALSARIIEGHRSTVGENHYVFKDEFDQHQDLLDEIEYRNRWEGESEEESSAVGEAVECQLSESDESLTPLRDQDMEERTETNLNTPIRQINKLQSTTEIVNFQGKRSTDYNTGNPQTIGPLQGSTYLLARSEKPDICLRNGREIS
jgi:hypothetical protein